RGAEQGQQRRGGRRARLRHRRAQGRGRGRGDRLSRGGGGRERLPDHRGAGIRARRARAGVRRPRQRRDGTVDPRRVRLRPPMRSLPAWILVPAVLGGLFVLLPLTAMAARVDWSAAGALLTSEYSLSALRLSVQTSGTSALLCVLVGVPMSLLLARAEFRGLTVVRSLVLLPLVLPPVVGGIALLYTFGRQGLLGRQLEVLEIGRAHV